MRWMRWNDFDRSYDTFILHDTSSVTFGDSFPSRGSLLVGFFHAIHFATQENASLVQRARRVKKMCRWNFFSQSVEQALPARVPEGGPKALRD